MLQEHSHPSLTQTAYQKHISCQDAIFATQEACRKISEKVVSYLSLYDLEKTFDSVEHCILLQSLFHAGINGKAWRLIKACYSNQTAVVKSGSTLSNPFPITRGVCSAGVNTLTNFLSDRHGQIATVTAATGNILRDIYLRPLPWRSSSCWWCTCDCILSNGRGRTKSDYSGLFHG